MKQQAKELLSQATVTLWANKFRSFLTLLGVVIGTATVIGVASLASGLEAGFKEQIEQFGTNVAFVSRLGGGPRHSDFTEEERQRKPILLEDAVALSQLPSAVAASPILRPPGMPPSVKFRNNEVRTPQVRGVWAGYANTREVAIARGRFFNDTEDQHSVEVAIIGYDIAERLLSGYEPLEKEIQIGNKVFRVIGVLEKSKNILGGGGPNADSMIFVPYNVMHAMYPMQDDHFVALGARQGELEKLVDDARELMRRRRNVPYDKPDSFDITTPSGIQESFGKMLSMVAMIVIPIVSVALLVGGIGVMNIMLVSVTERTKEIGVRRAIGAKRRDIIIQFLLEASMLTGIGGVLGIIFGYLISGLLKLFSFPSTVPLLYVAIGFSASVAIGLIAGMYPAYKASRLDPIEALRYE
ncbi:MAG TPA: ABC transporter permease [Blastocatellia bacterium]|nr:ABC transporter permease [Blastocatellia bacterium]HMV84715.1 ABC transporter permease [Blastocatellia bacterium]HMY71906.1 ABC transporter permease [Blastocatellia bacterium]HMZ19141.1 ABC transporter permease [Blastocatellia bacterium]HNG30309.1 ABC transporter permease [Blastocatellia bacterium]